MKLKEKMAKKYIDSIPALETPGFECEAFLAGFDLARVMAAYIVDEYTFNDDDEKARLTEGRGIFYRVNRIGEEETE